jgi:SSS family solute:Na+ symporter
MSEISIIVISVIIITVFGYTAYAVSLSRHVTSVRQFFLHTERLSREDLLYTYTASWMLLGSVMLAVVILGLVAGIANIWTIVTWALGFVILSRHAVRIKELTSREGTTTLHSFLGRRYGRPGIRILASSFTIIAALGAFALELIIGVALLQVVPGFSSTVYLPLAASVFFTLALAFYAAMGGFEAVIRTDRTQLFFIVIGTLAMVGLVAFHAASNPHLVSQIPNYLFKPQTSSQWSELWSATGSAFIVGLLFLQFFLMLGDMGSWQRIIASASGRVAALALKKVAWWTALLWIVFVVVGVLLWSHPSPDGLFPNPENILATQAEPFPSLLRLASPEVFLGATWVGLALVGLITAGLITAMLSSADTYIVVMMQTLTQDLVFANRRRKQQEVPGASDSENLDAAMLRFARRYLYVMAFAGLAFFWVLMLLGFDLLTLVFVIFGAQATLAPLAVAALSEDLTLERYATPALVSALIGFVAAYAAGVYAAQVGDPILSLWAPAVAVGVPTVVLSIVGWRIDTKRPWWLIRRMVLGDYRTA